MPCLSFQGLPAVQCHAGTLGMAHNKTGVEADIETISFKLISFKKYMVCIKKGLSCGRQVSKGLIFKQAMLHSSCQGEAEKIAWCQAKGEQQQEAKKRSGAILFKHEG